MIQTLLKWPAHPAAEKTGITPPGWLLGLLVLAWLLPGLVGHDPWKPDEAYSMGLIYHMMKSGDWIVPTLGGEPFMEKPPLYYITAANLATALSLWLPLHDGARLTSGFYMAIVLLCIGLTGRELYGKGSGRISVLLFMGCIGLLARSHQMITDTALLAGFAVAFYGLAIVNRRSILGGLLLGLGTGMGFMAKGLLGPVILGGVVCMLFLLPAWRTRRFAFSFAIALLAALPWFTIWPYSLYQHHPDLFNVWFWDNNYGRFFGSSVLATYHESGYYLKVLSWYSGPALPLALFALWRYRPYFTKIPTHARPPLQLPLVMATVILAILFLSSATRTLYLLPLMIPVALLATPALVGFTQQPHPIWNRVLTTLFVGLLVLIWIAWLLAMLDLLPATLWQRVGIKMLPEGGMPWQWIAFGSALLASVSWMVGIGHAKFSARGIMTGWSGSVTVIWLLLMTLWLPVIDHGKSYRSMVAGLQEAIPTAHTCIASRALGEPQRAMLHYFGAIFTRRLENGVSEPACDLLLIQSSTETISDPPTNGQLLWRGGRPGDTKEWYALYRLTP